MNRSKIHVHVRVLAARIRLLATGALILASAACGNLTAGGVGEASVAMSGDAPDEGGQHQMAVAPAHDPGSDSDAGSAASPQPTSHDDGPEGELEADVTVFLVPFQGEPVMLTDNEIRVEVDLEGAQEPEIGSRRVDATTYTILRLVFTAIDVEVAGGLVIGGVEVTGAIDVEIEQELTVDHPLNLDIEDGEQVELLVDLNSAAWLQGVDPVTRSIDAQVLANLVSVRVR